MTKYMNSKSASYYTEERIQGELYFCLAQEMAQALLAKGLISKREYIRLYDINRETFHPLFAEIMPRFT